MILAALRCDRDPLAILKRQFRAHGGLRKGWFAGIPGMMTCRFFLRFLLVPACLLLSPAAGAEPAYLAAPAELTTAPGGGEVLAKLQVAAGIEVTGSREGWRRVVLRGWAREGAERAMFARPGKQIFVAVLDRGAVDRLIPLGRETDPDTGIDWQQYELDGWVVASALSPDIEPLWSDAWELFSRRCTACHQRRVPANYTANQWRSHLGVMGPRTGLPKEKQAQILVFLQHHARDTLDDEIAAGTAWPPATRR